MQDTLTFEKLHQLFAPDFDVLGRSLEKISALYNKLPVSETVKKRIVDASLKNKSAWYACLVNSNIDVLLLPEYIESRQSRNILIKKETDQYFRSVENFDQLGGKSNTSLYECLLVTGDTAQAASIDLFSSHVTETDKCPSHIHSLYENWNLTLSGFSRIESIVFGFCEWHAANGGSFSAQRQHILWLNYQLWKQYGQAAFNLDLEHFLFGEWNKDKFSPVQSVRALLGFMQAEADRIMSLLHRMFREQIDFPNLKPGQKLASGYLFAQGFSTCLPLHVQQVPYIRILLRKGYLELSDLGQKADLEKVKAVLDELFEPGILMMVHEDNEWYISLNPSYHQGIGRLAKYANIKVIKKEVNWEAFIAQSVTKVIMPKIEKVLPEPEKEPVRKRQKAFFG